MTMAAARTARTSITPLRALVVFVAGGVLGTLCDQIHVLTHTLTYPDPYLFGQSWWVAPNFGVGVLGGYVLADLFAQREKGPPPSPARVALDAVLFLAAYLATGLFNAAPEALAAGLLVTALGRVWTRDDPSVGGMFALLLGIGGVVWESTLVSYGWFSYVLPGPTGGPAIWLAGVYFHAAPLALDIARTLQERDR